MAWPDPTARRPARPHRRRVDDRLAVLLAERAELTAAVQQLKDGRPATPAATAEREDEIVAPDGPARAPPRRATRLRRIMHAVITESLDAAQTRSADDATRRTVGTGVPPSTLSGSLYVLDCSFPEQHSRGPCQAAS